MKTRYKYVYVDPIHDSLFNIKKIIKKIKSLKNIKVYQEDDYIYIYGDNLIFGIDLNIMDFIGIDKYKLKNKIEKITNVLLSKNDIFICYNDLISEFNNDVKYITYFI
jgi:GTPase SAR1 family protein